MSCRLTIITEIIAPYRIPVFNALARQAGIELHVIFLSKTDTSLRQWRVYVDEIDFSFEILPSWRMRIGNHNVLLNRGVSSALGRSSPDVVICGGYNYAASWQALKWASRNRVPFLLWSESTARDTRAGRAAIESLKRLFFSKCAAFVVPGKSALEYLEKMGVSSHAIHIAKNAVDVGLFAELGRKAAADATRSRERLALPEKYFLFVGRLVREKGVLDLLQAYAALPQDLRQQTGLVFAGDGPLRAELEATSRCIYPGNVHFAGFVDRDALATYYALAECLVLPTYSDTWGLVVNEAMACGLPVICTKVTGCAADLVQNNGRLVEPGNIHELRQAMIDIGLSRSLRDVMASESWTMIQEFSPQTWASGIAEAAHTVAGHD